MLTVWVPLGEGRTEPCLNVCCYFRCSEKALGYGREKAKSRSNHKRENLAASSLSALPDVCHHHRDTVLVWQPLVWEIPVGLGKVGLEEVKQYRVRLEKACGESGTVQKNTESLSEPSCSGQ